VLATVIAATSSIKYTTPVADVSTVLVIFLLLLVVVVAAAVSDPKFGHTAGTTRPRYFHTQPLKDEYRHIPTRIKSPSHTNTNRKA